MDNAYHQSEKLNIVMTHDSVMRPVGTNIFIHNELHQYTTLEDQLQVSILSATS